MGRVQHPQVLRVVPVVQVTAIAGHAPEGLHRPLQPQGSLRAPDPAHVLRHRQGQKVQADTGGRCALRHLGARGFLKVVRRQEMVLPGHEGLEVPPGLARNLPQPRDLGRAQTRRAARGPGPACQGGPSRGRQPQDRKGQGKRQHRRIDRHRQCRPHQARRCAPGHQAILPRHSWAARPMGLRRRHPVQQVAARHAQPPGRAQGGIPHPPGRIGQKDHPQAHLSARHRQIRQQRRAMRARGDAGPSGQECKGQGQQPAKHQQGQQAGRPDCRLRQGQHPPRQQGRQGRGCHQRPTGAGCRSSSSARRRADPRDRA
jgi:hypothetical protein